MKRINKKGGASTRSEKKTAKDSFSVPLKNYNSTEKLVEKTLEVLIRPTLFDDIIDEKFLTNSSNSSIKQNKIKAVLEAFKDFSFSVSILPLDLQTGNFKSEENAITLLDHYKLVSDLNKEMNYNVNDKLMQEQIPLTMCKFAVKIHYENNLNSTIKEESIVINCFEESKKYTTNPESKTKYDNIYKIFISSVALNNGIISDDLEKIAIFINILTLISEKSIPKIRFDLGGSVKKEMKKNVNDLADIFDNFNFNNKKSTFNSQLPNVNGKNDNPYLIYTDYILTKIFKNIQLRKNVENTKAQLLQTIKEQELEEFKEIKENIKLASPLNILVPLPFEYDQDGNVIMTNATTGENVYPRIKQVNVLPNRYNSNPNSMQEGGLKKKSRKPRSKV